MPAGTQPRSRRSRLWWILLAGALLIGAAALFRAVRRPPPPPRLPEGVTPEMLAKLAALESRELEVERTVWAPEMLARRCGQTVDALWDQLNASSNRLAALRDWPLGTVQLPRWEPSDSPGHGIVGSTGHPGGPGLEAAGWSEFVDGARRQGWELDRVEFRHLAFDTNAAGGPRQSRYTVSAWLRQSSTQTRVTIDGEVVVQWDPEPDADGNHGIRAVEPLGLRVARRRGPIPFRLEFRDVVDPPDKSSFIDPLMVLDLEGDGRPELVLAAKNRAYWRTAAGEYAVQPLCRHDPGLIFTAVVSDFDGDRRPDFLCARFDGLWLIRSSASGLLDTPPEPAWAAKPRLRYGQVLTSGDVDGDGDLDVFLGQYQSPYDRGQMPTPYYDAADGNPSFLLENDGRGRFRDVTATSGLDPTIRRRVYSASWVDLDADGALDLAVVSDFAGVELHRNDGRGRFRLDPNLLPDRHGFGMAHALADFNRDGRLDLFVTGMHCPTANRLDHLRLVRPGFEAQDAMRGRMTRGNHLYLGGPTGFTASPLTPQLARSGWSWTCAAADFDNDGSVDVYVANGHETRQSVTDYEPEFWLHDIYVATSREDLVTAAYFGGKFARTRGRGHSYGGYEANKLFLNAGGRTYAEAGWLLGVGVEEDSRNAVAADLDADGRMDLVVTTFETWPQARQTLRVFRNQLPETGHWIGVRPPAGAAGGLPVGTVARIVNGEGAEVQAVVQGDGHRVQRPAILHFGLGPNPEVREIRLRWPDGRTNALTSPTVDRYHEVGW